MLTDADGRRDILCFPQDNPPNEEPEHQKDLSKVKRGGKSSNAAGLRVLRSP